jgi:hypothetical protein
MGHVANPFFFMVVSSASDEITSNAGYRRFHGRAPGSHVGTVAMRILAVTAFHGSATSRAGATRFAAGHRRTRRGQAVERACPPSPRNSAHVAHGRLATMHASRKIQALSIENTSACISMCEGVKQKTVWQEGVG